MAQQLGEAVALVCTSGTAVLNLFPAIVEASYQFISLIVITADRPFGAVDRGENQAIDQEGIYGFYTQYVPVNEIGEDKAYFKEVAKEISEAIDNMKTEQDILHINVLLDEPLYETTEEPLPAIPKIVTETDEEEIEEEDIEMMKEDYYYRHKKMLIVGVREYNSEFNKKVALLNARQDWVVITETTSNIRIDNTVWNIDMCLSIMDKKEKEEFVPELVVTMGNQIVSKKIKDFLKDKPQTHWDSPAKLTSLPGRAMFGDMVNTDLLMADVDLLDFILSMDEIPTSSFKQDWLILSAKAKNAAGDYLPQVPFSDLKVFETLVQSFPDNANIQYGNSSPVRYSNLFEHKKPVTVNANRGTSGIDGCVSTAAGAAYASKKMTIAVVGDVSFFYDSNALWNNYLSPDFRIVIINNGGGNIFRMIDGPTGINDFEKFFETKHNLSAKHLASMYDLPYYICDSQKGLDEILKTFYEPSARPKILEIKTDGILSAKVYKEYFEFLKQQA